MHIQTIVNRSAADRNRVFNNYVKILKHFLKKKREQKWNMAFLVWPWRQHALKTMDAKWYHHKQTNQLKPTDCGRYSWLSTSCRAKWEWYLLIMRGLFFFFFCYPNFCRKKCWDNFTKCLSPPWPCSGPFFQHSKGNFARGSIGNHDTFTLQLIFSSF